MYGKKYVKILILVIIIVVIIFAYVSNHLYSLDIPYTNVDFLRQYQMEKLKNQDDLELVVLGDSSTGNAIDAGYLSKLSGIKTANLALTGNSGFTSIYNMIRHVRKTQPNIKTIVMISTLSIWYRPFSEEGYYSTLYNLSPVDFSDVISNSNRFSSYKYQYNPKEIYWFLKYKLKNGANSLEFESDYVKQQSDKKKYSDGSLIFDKDSHLFEFINSEKIKMLRFIGELCEENSLNCIFLHGPIHEGFYLNSINTISLINENIKDTQGVNVITDVLSYPEKMFGNGADHIDPKFKRDVTKDYFNVVKNYLP